MDRVYRAELVLLGCREELSAAGPCLARDRLSDLLLARKIG